MEALIPLELVIKIAAGAFAIILTLIAILWKNINKKIDDGCEKIEDEIRERSTDTRVLESKISDIRNSQTQAMLTITSEFVKKSDCEKISERIEKNVKS